MTVHENDLNLSDTHATDEVGFIISGKMCITLGEEYYLLEAGDSIYIPAQTFHSFQKLSDEDVVSLWVYAPLNR